MSKNEIEDLKESIRNCNYDKYQTLNDSKKLIGTMFVKEKMEYGFHLYYIHEPSDSDPLAGVNGIVSEMYYDLRNKIYWIKRNGKEVKFSARNVDSIFPRYDRGTVFELLSTKGNQGLYKKAFSYLGAMSLEKREMFGRFFYRLITDYSYLEQLYKVGIEVDKYTKIIDPNGRSPMEILGLSKTQWKIINKYKVPFKLFNGELSGIDRDNKMINYLSYIKSLEDEFGVDKALDFFKNESDNVYGKKDYYNRSAVEIAKRYNLPEKKFLRYIYFECDVSQGLSAYDAISQYKDYIRMTSEMGYERFDRYPKFLRTSHDIASRNYKINLNEVEMAEWNNSYENNKKFEFNYQGYKIFPPKDPSDLVKEGNVLGHCVGSYVGKVRKGTSTILFLREKDDVESPLVTIEVSGDRISQSKGRMNNPPTLEQKEIIKSFAKKFQLAV